MATLLAQIIVREIVENGYKPGDRLAPERQMLETYSVSRGTLREALRFLEIQGVLEIRTGPNGGPIVKEPSFQNLARSLALLMQLDGSTFRVVVNARQALEPMVIAQGALVITDEELDELERSLGRLDSSGYEADDYSQQNWEFHDAIARACGNPLLWVVVSSLHWMTERIVGDFPFTEERQREHRDAHAAILAALRLREPATASEAMRQHLSYFSQWLEEEKPDLLDAPIEWHQM
jgi:DNA-binding FadR family transcriptional regulator